MARKLWLPGAERIPGPHAAGLPMSMTGEHIATHHITVTAVGSYAGAKAALLRQGTEPCLTIDPQLGKFGQFFPANRGGYALENRIGGIETNRLGDINLQTEWVWDRMNHDIREAKHFDECWERFVEFARQLGIPDVWPFGFASTAKTASKQHASGHRGHVNWAENSHSDNLPAAKQPAWPDAGKPLAADTAEAVALVTRRLTRRKAKLDHKAQASLRELRSAINGVL